MLYMEQYVPYNGDMMAYIMGYKIGKAPLLANYQTGKPVSWENIGKIREKMSSKFTTGRYFGVYPRIWEI